MKNLILIVGLIATTALSAQDAVQYNIDIAPFNHLDYTFADIFIVNAEGDVNQICSRQQLLPGSGLSGRRSHALTVGSLVIIDMYNRYDEFTHSYSAYVLEDNSGDVYSRVVEPSSKVSLIVGAQESYIDFLEQKY